MIHEATIPFRARPLRVALTNPEMPLPSVRLSPTPVPAAPGPPPPPAADVVLSPTPAQPQPVVVDPAESERRREERELIERTLANLAEVGQGLYAQQQQRLAEAQQVAVQLAAAIASRLVHQQIDSGDFAVERLVRHVVQRLEPEHAVTVHLHPADLALLEERLGDSLPLFHRNVEIQVVADETLARGDCRAETGDVSILSCLEEQLNGLRQHLVETLVDAEVERRRAAAPGEQKLVRFPDRRHTA